MMNEKMKKGYYELNALANPRPGGIVYDCIAYWDGYAWEHMGTSLEDSHEQMLKNYTLGKLVMGADTKRNK